MAELRLLITGATGYIGGSVLSAVLESASDEAKKMKISALVRRKDQAEILAAKGVNPILFEDLNQSDVLRRAASDHDIVINCADGFHFGSAKALIEGLGKRKQQTGRDVYFIHTSGTSNLGDRCISGLYTETRVFSDKDNIYQYEKYREDMETYPQRTTDLVVVKTGLKLGVKTYIVMSPTIYGFGNGFFHTVSIQIPTLIRTAIEVGHAEVVKDGKALWNHVHIWDLAMLYELVLRKLVAGEDLPFGERGIYFSETGQHSWLELAEGVGNAGFVLGALQSPTPAHITLDQAAERWGNGSVQYGELGWCSMSRTRADLSRELGWKPQKTRKAFEHNFVEEFAFVLAQKKE